MRWDYDFGAKGDNGYKHETMSLLLEPAQARLLVSRNRAAIVIYTTQGLRSFSAMGLGSFIAEVTWGKDAFSDRLTFALQPNSLSYLWEARAHGAPYAIVNKSVFRRIRNSSRVEDATHNPE